jgi:hypothetical protein
MNLYIHPLKGIFHPSHRKIYSFLHSSILCIILHPLWSLLITLSKYIHVRSSFEEFIKTNSMVQSKFYLGFWFVRYNIFLFKNEVGPCYMHLSLSSLSRPPTASSQRMRVVGSAAG